MCRALLVLCLLLTCPSLFAARVALVIGNAAYKESPLKNPVNDARDMGAKLKELGFSVILKENLKRKEIPATLRAFRSQIKPGDDVLFFYAGHGLQVKGVNYLPAVDADISSEDEVDMESLSLNKLLELLDESKAAVKLVFLDACRNNPYARSFRSADRGLSRIGNTAPSGTIISFATKPGSVAADGSGKNGLYTEQLLKHIAIANTPIELMLKNVVRDVKQASSGQQEPWMEGSLDGEFLFRKQEIQQVASLTPAYSATPMALPGTAGVYYGDIEKARHAEAAVQKQWEDWQKRMQADFDTAAQFKGDMAVTAWDRFLQAYTANNPYSTDDERLRGEAQKRKLQAKTADVALNYAEIEKAQREEELKTYWAEWQGRMVADFKKLSAYKGKAAVLAWDNYLKVYAADNPHSTDDDKLRAEAQKRRAQEDTKPDSVAADSVDALLASAGTGSDLIANRYRVLGDGSEVLDTKTKLIWKRCVEGMKWDGKTCTGKAETYIHDSAVKLAEKQATSEKVWRLPEVSELKGLIVKKKGDLAINQEVFPATPNERVWSGESLNSPITLVYGTANHRVYVDYALAREGSNPANYVYAVRLVRKALAEN